MMIRRRAFSDCCLISNPNCFRILRGGNITAATPTTTSCCVALFQFNSVSHFSTIFNPNPKPFIPSSSNPNAQLQLLLYDKSKVCFDKLDGALAVFDKMLKMKHLLPVINFNQVLMALVKLKDYSIAVSLFRRMCSLTTPVNIYTFAIVIDCYCRLSRVDYGFSLLAGIIKRGFVPDVVTYTTLLKGLLSQDKSLEAELLFKNLLIYKEIQPDAVIFNIIIDGLCKTGHTSVAVRYMEKKGCMPSTVTYGTIIDSLSKDRLVDDALGLLAEMSDKGIQPDVITYSSLIQGLCNLNRWKDIMQLLRDMDSRKISLDVHTYTILVDAHGRDGKIKVAEDLIELMIRRGQYPNVVTYGALMDGYCLRGELDKALAVLETMRSRLVEARKFFKKMRVNQGLQLNIVTCRILLHGLCQNGCVAEALPVFHMMECNGLIPDLHIYSILILETI